MPGLALFYLCYATLRGLKRSQSRFSGPCAIEPVGVDRGLIRKIDALALKEETVS
jgi:hypothetical protein